MAGLKAIISRTGNHVVGDTLWLKFIKSSGYRIEVFPVGRRDLATCLPIREALKIIEERNNKYPNREYLLEVIDG